MLVSRFTEDFQVPFHEHDFIEFCYVAEGTGFHHIERETFPVHKGWLFVLPVGAAHVFRPTTPDSSGKPPVVYNCLFDVKLARELAHDYEELVREHLEELTTRPSSYYAVFDKDGSIESLMLKLHLEMSRRETGSITMLHALLNQLIITVYRLTIGTSKRQGNSMPSDIRHIVYYLEQNMEQSLTLSDASRFAGWSARHLQRIFLKHTGQTFGAFVQHLRIRKSCEMLRGSTLKIGAIAELVGYRSIDAFNAAFKRTVGLTPSAYRQTSRSP